jgi:hypothetical protein
MKSCTGCGIAKPLGEFNRDSRQADGLRNRCRVCTRAEMAAWRAAHPDAQRQWLAANRQRQVEYDREQTARSPEKRRARRKLQWAVEVGTVVKPTTCSSCGGEGRIEAHHDDYTKPYDVLWLCVGCHRRMHMEGAR